MKTFYIYKKSFLSYRRELVEILALNPYKAIRKFFQFTKVQEYERNDYIASEDINFIERYEQDAKKLQSALLGHSVDEY